MGRKVRDASLETRNARLKLPTGGKPRWRLIEAGSASGYRRPKDGKGSGTWIARRYVGQGSYQEKASEAPTTSWMPMAITIKIASARLRRKPAPGGTVNVART